MRAAAVLALALLFAATHGGEAARRRTLRRLSAVAAAPGPAPASTAGGAYARNGADFCNCGDEDAAVCGIDQQTYLNECVMKCAGGIKLKDGRCDPACYPPDAASDGGDWDSLSPVCASGLTYMNEAEAMYDGYPKSCMTPGVCKYAEPRPGEVYSFEPTTGGKGKSVAAAAANTTMPDPSSPPYDYSEALAKSLIFYDSEISGMIEPNYKRLDWRGDSCFSCKGKYGEDLSGGYYESGGSNLKLGAVSAYVPLFLATTAFCFPEGYNNTGLLDELKFKVKWGADFLINSHVEDYVYMGSMGNATEAFDNYAPLELFEKYSPPRIVGYCTKDDPCSEITADAAAALAAASVLLKGDNPAWAANALAHAVQLYKFASEYPRSYMDTSDPAVQVFAYLYESTGFKDELAFAAAMLYKATGEEQYKQDAQRYFDESPDTQTQELGELKPLTAVLMSQLDPGNSKYGDYLQSFFDQYLSLEGEIKHTKCGLAIPYHWGALTHGPNVAMLGMCYGKGASVDPAYRARLFNYGQHQVDYVLGDCGRSWLVGFGKDYPQHLHQLPSYNSILVWKDENDPLGERIAGTNFPGPITTEKTDRPMMWMKGMVDFYGNYFPQRHIAYGTMFGAPLMDDGMVTSRRDYTYTEPTVIYNTAIVGALAGLAEYYGAGPWSGELLEVNQVNYSSYLQQ